MPEDGGIDVSTFTPEQQAALQAQLEPQGVDPVDMMDASQLAELSVQTKGEFDPIAWADANQSKAFEPATLKKLSDARDIITSRGLGGFVPSDIAAVQSIKEGKPVEAVGKVVKPVAETVGNIAKWFGNTIIANPANMAMGKAVELFGGDPDLTNELYKQAAKGSAETVAGVESAMFGLANTGKKVGAAFTEDFSEEGKKQKFLSDLGLFQQQAKIGAGQGEFAQAEGTSAEEMAKLGIVLDPEVIAERASGDPFAFYAFGKAFQAITPAGKVLATIPGVAGLRVASRALASKGYNWAAQTGVNLTGKAISTAGAATGLAGKAAPITGAVVGAVKGGPWGVLPGIAGGEVAARTIASVAGGLKTGGKALSDLSKNLAAEAGPAGSYTQLARDIIASAPPALGAVAKGAAIDFGFAAAVSETPQETEEMATFGTTFGALHGVAGAGKRIVQGQALGARPWGTTEKTQPYGNFAELDAAHAKSEQIRKPEEIQRSDAARSFAAKLAGGAETYLMPDTVTFENFLINQHTRKTGAAPEGQALADIKANALSRGMFSEKMLDDSGNLRKVIILNEVDAAPHEATHAIQDVIGVKANEVADALVKKEYAGQWEVLGEDYARRLGAAEGTQPWRETIKQRTGWEDADIYLARELAAENFDIGFKNKGGDFGRGNTLPEKLARIAVKTAVFFGFDPYVGTQTQGLRIQPKADVIEAVEGQAKLAKQTPPVIQTPPTAPFVPIVVPRAPAAAPAKPSVTPTAPKVPPTATSSVSGVSPDAKAAQAWAAGKNDPRLVNIVNSIVANQVKSAPGEAAPVRLKYLSVAGEEGSTRTPRRSEQEAAYLAEALGAMPAETRQLVEKTHAHVRFDPVKKGNEMQSIGYSLEKLVENAQRAAKWMSENPEAAKLSPYAVEGTSFSAEGWKQLVSHIETYTSNQQAGGTGAGKALVQPANAAKLGISVPPVQAAKLVPLEQSRADFINTLMGFKLPETTRVSRAGGTPGNIVGQDISRANEQPFIQPRVSEPATPRAGGKEFPGFPGRTIQEVNPIRKNLEAAGFPVNELTEVVERVNLKNLESVTPAPESSFRPGVTDTIRAGFLPPAEKPKWLVKGQKGGLKTQAEFEGADMGEARRKAEAQGYRVSSVERTNPIELRTQFLPAEEEATNVEKLTRAELQGWAAGQQGGFTATAHRVGREATSQEFVNSLRARADRFKDEAIAGMKDHDFDASMTSSTKAQFFREAWEAATGVGSAGERLKSVDANYKPPFPESPKTQFSPKDSYETLMEKMSIPSSMRHDYRRVANRMNAGITRDEFLEMPQSDRSIIHSFSQHLDEKKPRGFERFNPKYGTPKTTGETVEMLSKAAEQAGLRSVDRYNELLLVQKEVFQDEAFVREFIEKAPIEQFQKAGGTEAIKEVFSRLGSGESLESLYDSLPYEKWPIVLNAVRQWELKTHPGEFQSMEEAMKDIRASLAGRYGAANADKIIAYGEDKLKKTQFSPKEKDPYEKYNRAYEAAVAKRKAGTKSGLTGWILPDNKFTPLSSNYHEQYLAENSAALNKKFGTKFSEKENVEERQQALDKGFVRMRMQGGTLHVEAGQAGWTKAARDKIFETVADNLDSIDQIQVSVLDKTGIVKRQGSERLMDYDTDAEKLNNIPLISEGRSAFLPAESQQPIWKDNILESLSSWQNKGTPAQLRAHLAKSKGTLEQSDWIGLEDFLKDKPSVTKEQVAEFVRANAVEIREVEKGKPFDEGKILTRARNEFKEGADATKFEQYVLPGGENYRELLLTLPEKDTYKENPISWVLEENKEESDHQGRPMMDVTDQTGRVRFTGTPREARNYLDEENMRGPRNLPNTTFKSSHFDEPNILAHVRFDERTDSAGKPMLFVEEVQSDWHQQGRDEGYGPAKAIGGGVPDAPYKNTWPMLVMRRMIRYAAENGFDKLGWVTGEQTAARYDLSKHVDSVHYNVKTQRLTAAKGTRSNSDYQVLLDEQGIAPERLADYIGKDTAGKLMESEPSENGLHTLSGDDLKVGGQWAHNLYDKQLPNEVNKFAKKFGVRVGESEIAGDKSIWHAWDKAGKPLIYRGEGLATIEFPTEKAARYAILDNGGTMSHALSKTVSIHSLDITPEMKAAALGGVMQFQPKGKPQESLIAPRRGQPLGYAVPQKKDKEKPARRY